LLRLVSPKTEARLAKLLLACLPRICKENGLARVKSAAAGSRGKKEAEEMISGGRGKKLS
jgi:hypothetical protein